MFCIVGLRCSSEGPSLRRDPAKAVGRLLQLPPLRQLAPKAPGGAGSRVCAATRLGAAGVAGGGRTDLGDQSGGGMVLSKADRGRTAEPSSLLATATRQAPCEPRPPAWHSFNRLCRSTSCPPPEGPVIRDVIEQAIGFPGPVWHRPASSAKGSVPLHREGARKAFSEALRSEVDRCSGVSTAKNCGFAPMNRFQSRAKRAGSDGDMPAMNSLSVLGGTTEAR